MWPFDSSSPTGESTPPSACPVDHDTRQEWLKDQQPPSSSTRPPEHRLSEEREVSSIPRWLPPSTSSDPTPSSSSVPPSACPAHDPNFNPSDQPLNSAEKAAIVPSESNWVYPSPSSFYRALSSKNRNPNPIDMEVVVPIHNAVNERVWQQVLDWERLAMGLKEGEETGVKLVSFMGRPKQMSPRARWKSIIGYTAPFDRHDWIIDRPVQPPSATSPSSSSPSPSTTTTESIRVRYVIDFYTGRGANLLSQQLPSPTTPTSPSTSPNNSTTTTTTAGGGGGMPNLAFFIDCRPALDGWEGVRMRFNKYWGIGGVGNGEGSKR
ncbi:hypothetical protein JCM16303_001331 [Sporobolomyces ruberrimus]